MHGIPEITLITTMLIASDAESLSSLFDDDDSPLLFSTGIKGAKVLIKLYK